jgi:laccase
VVQVDASYVKPFTATTVVISPGQTMDVLLTAAANLAPPAFAMAVAPCTNTVSTFDNTTAAAVLEYSPQRATALRGNFSLPPLLAYNDTGAVANSWSLASARYPAHVPRTVDHGFFFAVGLGLDPCRSRVNGTCQGPKNGTRFAASMNNVSFNMLKTSLPQGAGALPAAVQGRAHSLLSVSFGSCPARIRSRACWKVVFWRSMVFVKDV